MVSPGRANQGPRGQPQVLDERHERLLPAGAPEPALVDGENGVMDGGDVPKSALGRLTSCGTALSLLLEVARPHVEVEIHLVADVGAEVRPEEAEVAAPSGARP